jgi:hypothetical protein
VGLGIAFGVKRSDGGLPVIEADPDGAVATAGGRVGDVWQTIDGDPVIAVFDGWLDGTRIRTPGAPIMVRLMRASVGMTIAIVDGPEATGADDGADLVEETPNDESPRSESSESALPPITLRDRLRAHLGKPPLDADTEALLKRDSGPTRDPHRSDNWAKHYDPLASKGDIERFWRDTERLWKW